MRKNIHARVKHLVNKFDTRDPAKLAKELKINIIYKPYSEFTKGYYIRALRNKFIVVNSNLDDESQRIVLAHELGHAYLHSEQDICFIREHTLFPTGPYEYEANKFAAELIIEDNILKSYPGLTIEQIAAAEMVDPKLIKLKFGYIF